MTKYMLEMTSVSVVAIVAITAVVLIVLNLTPGFSLELDTSITGNAINYRASQRPITTEFNYQEYDFNNDGIVDFYDYDDALHGECANCDLNGDGVLDNKDREAFHLLVKRLYDYDNNGKLERADARILVATLLGEPFSENHVYDLNGDGILSNEDITRYTGIIFNFDRGVA